MDIKTDIFNNIKDFQSEMEAAEQLTAIQLSGTPAGGTAASLAAFASARNTRSRGRGQGIPQPQPLKTRTFCKTCYDNEKGKSTYLSHPTDAYNCPTKVKLNVMVEELLPPEVLEEEASQETTDDASSQVVCPALYKINTISAGLSTITPVPTQLLTVSDNNGQPLHLELDSAATVNYITLDEARAHNFIISRNSQVSKLVMVLPPS